MASWSDAPSKRRTRWPQEDGASVEVVDLRTLLPLDRETVCASVRKTSQGSARARGHAHRRHGRRTGRQHHGKRLRISRRPHRARDGAGHARSPTARRWKRHFCPMRKSSGKGSLAVSLLGRPLAAVPEYHAGIARPDRSAQSYSKTATVTAPSSRRLPRPSTVRRRFRSRPVRPRAANRSRRHPPRRRLRRRPCRRSRNRACRTRTRRRCLRRPVPFRSPRTASAAPPSSRSPSAAALRARTVRSPIRSAFQMVDLARSLQHRGETSPVYPVQAIALGNQVTILAVGGNVSEGPYRAPKRIVVLNANDSFTPPPDPRIDTAIRQVLARIGR